MRTSLSVLAFSLFLLAFGCSRDNAASGKNASAPEKEKPVESKDKPVPEKPKEDAWVTTASGLRYLDIKVGKGNSPRPTDRVRVHYEGALENGKVFDSSYKRREPIVFPLNGVIKGWQEGLSTMKPGGKRKLIIPSKLGYGAAGMPPAGIPGGATLLFDVELIEVLGR